MRKLIKDMFHVLPFGSRAWGGWKEESDWDYAINDRLIPDVKTLLGERDVNNVTWIVYEDNKLFNEASVKFTEDGEVYNLIFYSDNGMTSVERLNYMMEGLGDIDSKKVRCALVELFLYSQQPPLSLLASSLK